MARQITVHVSFSGHGEFVPSQGARVCRYISIPSSQGSVLNYTPYARI